MGNKTLDTNHRRAQPLRTFSVIQMSECRSRFLSAVIGQLFVLCHQVASTFVAL